MPSEKPRILVVDDEPRLIRLVTEVLGATGFRVLSATSGEKAVELVALEQPDLVLLDIILADEMDGYEVARRIRQFSDLPIIMLTARARESDVVRGFATGADDYLTKPFSSKELLARVRAVLHRSSRAPASPAAAQLVCGPLQIDLARHRVLREGSPVHLTRTEFELLKELAQHRGQVLLHEQLLTAVWGSEYRDDLDYLRAYVRYLRRKLERDPANPELIQTIHGVGYMLDCPPE
jgi:two-component system KDP operon response regulator KdpE